MGLRDTCDKAIDQSLSHVVKSVALDKCVSFYFVNGRTSNLFVCLVICKCLTTTVMCLIMASARWSVNEFKPVAFSFTKEHHSFRMTVQYTVERRWLSCVVRHTVVMALST